MPGGDLRLLIAYDLRWFAPEDAKRCVARAIEAGLLSDEAGVVRPTFDVRAIEIPLNFRPSSDIFDDAIPLVTSPSSAPSPPPASPLPPPSSSGIERAAEEERRRRGLRLSLDVARLVVRRRAGEDVVADAAALESRIFTHG